MKQYIWTVVTKRDTNDEMFPIPIFIVAPTAISAMNMLIDDDVDEDTMASVTYFGEVAYMHPTALLKGGE